MKGKILLRTITNMAHKLIIALEIIGMTILPPFLFLIYVFDDEPIIIPFLISIPCSLLMWLFWVWFFGEYAEAEKEFKQAEWREKNR